MDERVTYAEQLQEDEGPIVLVNVFNVAPEDAERLVEVWADDAAFMKQQPGLVSTQLHRGTGGSSTFVNVVEWESARALGEAFGSPVPKSRRALPGQRRRVPACVREGSRSRGSAGRRGRRSGSPAGPEAGATGRGAGATRAWRCFRFGGRASISGRRADTPAPDEARPSPSRPSSLSPATQTSARAMKISSRDVEGRARAPA